MAKIKLKGKTLRTHIKPPMVGSKAPAFKLVKSDLSEVRLKDFKGRKIILYIFPSVDTDVCADSIRSFNQKIASLKNTVLLSVSMDLPFAHKRFCTTEKINKATMLSAFRSTFGKEYGLEINDSPFKGLLARSVIVIDEKGKVIYTQVVPEIATEPDYEAVLAAVK